MTKQTDKTETKDQPRSGREVGGARESSFADASDYQWLQQATDEQVTRAARSDADAQPTDEAFWEGASTVLPPLKKNIHIGLDADIVEWFKEQGPRYQTRMNAVLRHYVDTQRSRRQSRHD